MKKANRIGSSLLALTIGISALSLAGCRSNKDTTKVDDYTPTERYTEGTHSVSITYSSTNFVKNGTCDWKVLIDEDAGAKIEAAASEFISLFEEATGIKLELVRDSEITYTSTSRYISFGNNAFAKSAEITLPSTLKSNGYIIRSVGQSICVVGGKDLGTQFGAYGLLNGLFDYEYYFCDTFGNECYYIDKNISDMNFPICDVFDNPDFDHAIAGYLPMFNDSITAHKMRMETINEVYIQGNGIGYVHNTLQYIPASRYQNEHPNWFSVDGKQLCYTARGDATERTLLIETLAETMIQQIKDQPDGEIITVTQMDTSYWCECESCRALKTQYGTDSASCIQFTNEVADKIEEWRAKEAPERKITVVMFAYNSTENPPAEKDSDGNWKAIDDSVKLRDNVCLLFAPINSVRFNHNMQDEENKKAEELLQGWEACAEHISVWSYSSMFYNYFMPYDTYSTCQNQYKRWLDSEAIWIFDNAQYDTKAPLGFSSLKAYLNSAWSWDVNRNYNELVDGFFENYFGVKDGSMKKFYNELRLWLKGLDEDGVDGLTGTAHADWEDENNWSPSVLNQWVGYCKSAKEEISALKTTDAALYEVICNRIDIETLLPRYILLELFQSSFSAEELIAERKSFAADCKRLGITKFAENKSIDVLIENW